MTLCGLAELDESPSPDATLAVLADALKGRRVAAACRAVASDDRCNPDEGLALLDAYLGIADRRIRQAILDAAIAIAGSDPYRRTRRTIGRASVDRER